MAAVPNSLPVSGECRRLMLTSVVVALVAWPAGSQASTFGSLPEESKANFLQKILPYIEWPPTAFTHAKAPIVLGVLDCSSMFEALSRWAPGRHVHGRPVEVRQLSAQGQVQGVHLIYVGADSWAKSTHLLSAPVPAPVLVTSAPGGIDQGATIGFVTAGQRVRIEASLAAAQKAGVKMSSRLLAVAHRVLGAQK